MKIITRDVPPRAAWALEQSGLHPLLARLFAARGITSADELDDTLARLLPPASMKGAAEAARALADAMAAGQSICIVADYDCDGATACAVGLRGLRLLGAPMGFDRVNYLVPDRSPTAMASHLPSPSASRPRGPMCWSRWTTASPAWRACARRGSWACR
jgi:single-stranded-DNA-specific exonuclease